ncbi:type III-A CRISPR-associated protein Csm2 [Methanopyrus sp.]
MGAELRPAELAEKFLYKSGVLDRNRRKEVESRFEELLEEFKKQRIQLKPSEDRLLELAFFTALVSLNVSNSQLRRIYAEITNVRNRARRALEGRDDWDDVVAALGKARVVLAYAKGRQGKELEPLYKVMDEALRRATKIVEGAKGDEVRERAIEAVHFLTQGIIAFHRFLGAK